MLGLGTETLDKAVTVKLTRTLAIIPITLVLAFIRTKKAGEENGKKVSIKKIFPFFIIYFVLASLITTVATNGFGVPTSFFAPFKELSKFFIILAMAAIGLNTSFAKLKKSGIRPMIHGFIISALVVVVALLVEICMGIV